MSLLTGLDRICLSYFANALKGARCRISLWNALEVDCSDESPIATVTFHDRATLWKVMARPDVMFGEAYTSRAIDVSGDLTGLMSSINLAIAAHKTRNLSTSQRSRSFRTKAARRHVRHHYDLGNQFFRLWLDRAMVYTCAYYQTPSMSLEDAQQAKLDYVCQKLRLRPGDRVIEAGSGWGALAVHMAKQYGASVRSFNISTEQLQYARERAASEGVSDRVHFIDGDFRTITGSCDAFVSIGMLEHVGLAEYRALGEVIDRVLDRQHGRGLLHFIGRNQPMNMWAWTRRHIFPGSYAPVLSEVTERVLEPSNLSVLDVENLRWHYAATLRDWHRRFDEVSTEVARMFDDAFVRMWRFYLAGAEASFRSGDSQLFQVTFARPLEAMGRWTRQDLYTGATKCMANPAADHAVM